MSLFALVHFIILNVLSLFSCTHARIAFHALCTSTLFSYIRTCSLVTSLIFLTVVSSLMMSVIIMSSLISFRDCSFMHLSFPLYSHSLALIFNWPIHSSAISFSFILSLHYCHDKIVSLCWSLNFSLHILKSPMLDLHFPFSSLFSVCVTLSPTHPTSSL